VTGIFLGGKARPARKADNLTAICEPIVKKMWEPQPHATLWAFMACYKDGFTLPFIFYRRLLLQGIFTKPGGVCKFATKKNAFVNMRIQSILEKVTLIQSYATRRKV
jgi:hypothetical protein